MGEKTGGEGAGHMTIIAGRNPPPLPRASSLGPEPRCAHRHPPRPRDQDMTDAPGGGGAGEMPFSPSALGLLLLQFVRLFICSLLLGLAVGMASAVVIRWAKGGGRGGQRGATGGGADHSGVAVTEQVQHVQRRGQAARGSCPACW